MARPEKLHKKQKIDPASPAVILFTSGSEGEPKGVVLSHINLMTNIVQLSSRVDFNRQDIVFNCLPMFHSFGLTGGTMLPVLSGVKTFLYPSPMHYRIVPEMVYSANATIMFGTDTFLQGYARMANPYDFFRMRYIFAGAEKVKDETRRVYMEKFGVQVLEGYGATETAPALTLNSAMHQKNGSVGRFLPGIEYRLEDVPGVAEGDRLYVRGPNVMLGYYKAGEPGILQPLEDGWHDTGDIVSVDDDGFVYIRGRAKRFAKIAGEMVSLAQVESMADTVWPGMQHAVIAIPDPRKGEQLIMVTTQETAGRDALSAYASKHGITALAVPATILQISKMPVLGSGKIDYQAVKLLVETRDVKAA
jgi:acyl-[acyl-carrier-protein]-phospholipid O-acyltransferase/long-chain-fatty-acid--[acyl-carrier-protein] ligase